MAVALPTTAPSIPSTVRTTRPMTSRFSRPNASKFIVDWNQPNESDATRKVSTNKNLQEAFSHFREERMKELRLHEKIVKSKKKKLRRSDPERMRKLRLKFVEQAKKYLGVPYARKYFQPGTPEYESKLFLDCCGLVRRVMYDLAKDFGFVIGPWNQSYMFDTLPTTITHLSDVQPGDLVFISATYYNPKMKKQRHNLTHVEIMLGDGEKTIGARWNNGVVQFFDSYKFVSKSYHSQIYTIKSLDPWLKGICKSHCSEHSWYRRPRKKLTKKSIFYPSDSSSHSRKTDKSGTSQSSSSSINSSRKKSHHRRKRKRRTARSKSHKRTVSAKEVPENESQPNVVPPADPSDDEEVEEDQTIVLLNEQIAAMNCGEEEDDEQSDDSDSLDEAIDAECLEDEDLTVDTSILPETSTDIGTTVNTQ